MSTTTIRVDQKTRDQLARLARSQKRPMSQIVSEAVSRYEDEVFWQRAREGYERMNAEPEDRAAYDAEMRLWDTALADGLDESPYEEDEQGGS
jgi:predicted DNA-binding protein